MKFSSVRACVCVRVYVWQQDHPPVDVHTLHTHTHSIRSVVLNFQFMEPNFMESKVSFAIYFIAFLSSTSDDLQSDW